MPLQNSINTSATPSMSQGGLGTAPPLSQQQQSLAMQGMQQTGMTPGYLGMNPYNSGNPTMGSMGQQAMPQQNPMLQGVMGGPAGLGSVGTPPIGGPNFGSMGAPNMSQPGNPGFPDPYMQGMTPMQQPAFIGGSMGGFGGMQQPGFMQGLFGGMQPPSMGGSQPLSFIQNQLSGQMQPPPQIPQGMTTNPMYGPQGGAGMGFASQRPIQTQGLFSGQGRGMNPMMALALLRNRFS